MIMVSSCFCLGPTRSQSGLVDAGIAAASDSSGPSQASSQRSGAAFLSLNTAFMGEITCGLGLG